MPIETLLKPADLRAANFSNVTVSGLASVVISAFSAKPKVCSSELSISIKSAAGSNEGVPPPKKTVLNFLGGTLDCSNTWAEKWISEISEAA